MLILQFMLFLNCHLDNDGKEIQYSFHYYGQLFNKLGGLCSLLKIESGDLDSTYRKQIM